jgi:hypothetical protein
MSYGPVTFDTPEIALEDIICEIIDNSIAANATHIHVQIGNDVCAADGEPSLHFDVFDNGLKVRNTPWTEEHIKKAFEIEYDPNDPPIRALGETGKFHVGMKIATLSKFDTVSMVTLIDDDEFLQQHGTYPSLERLLEETENRYGLSKNPSPSPPDTVNVPEIVSILKGKSMSTWVGGRTPRVALLFGNRGNDRAYKSDYIKHLRIYFGMIYQLYLEDNDFKLTLGLWDNKVAPVDPFWENFSTENLNLHAATLSDPDEKRKVQNLARFGTLAQSEGSFDIGGEIVQVQGFIVPQGKTPGTKHTPKYALKKAFPRLTINTGDTTVFSGGISDSGSPSLKSSNTGGFYIYRGKRCINFGGKPENHHGFYNLKNPITSSWATRLKVKVKYTSALDREMVLHPNKHSFRTISNEIWTGIKGELSKTIGGDNRARPYDVSLAFCTWGGKSQFSKMLATDCSPVWSYSSCETCKLLIHEKNDYCDMEKCEKCGELANENQCNKSECNTECIHCSEVGLHPSKTCPEIECVECGGYHTGDQGCFCEFCGNQDCDGCEEEEGDEEGEGDDDTPDDETVSAEWFVDDNIVFATLPLASKDSCIEKLREILNELDINSSEFE